MKKLKATVLIVSVITVSLAIGAYAVNQSLPWHTAQEIVNSGGRVFDDQGRIYKCDSTSNPGTTADVDLNQPNHPIQQFAKSAGNPDSLDSDGNGWPDVGLELAEPGSQSGIGLQTHPISQIRRGVAGAENQMIDSNGNGWPDKCDCVLSETDTDPNNCGSCGNACPSGQICADGTCITYTPTWHLVWERFETYGGWCQDTDEDSPWYNCNQLGDCMTQRYEMSTYCGYYVYEDETCSTQGVTCFDCWGTYGQFWAWVYRCE